jgi:hypothetical protein
VTTPNAPSISTPDRACPGFAAGGPRYGACSLGPVPWVMLFIGLTFAGLVVISVCAIKVFLAVRDLGREIQHTRGRLAPKHSALRTAARRLEETG